MVFSQVLETLIVIILLCQYNTRGIKLYKHLAVTDVLCMRISKQNRKLESTSASV